MKVVSFAEVQEHRWIVLHEKVYNLKDFPHPGGMDILRPWFGRDGTAAFAQHHSVDLLSTADKYRVGVIDRTDVAWQRDVEAGKSAALSSSPVQRTTAARQSLPPLAHMLNAFDFERAAERVMDPAAWAYYDSGGDDEKTLRENRAVFSRIWLRPRVMVNVRQVSTACTLLHTRSRSPLYVSATALARLADPAGEVAIVRACHRAGDTLYMLPTLSSCSLMEMTAARAASQTQWFQLYVNPDRKKTEELVRRAEGLGCKALFVTVDAPQLGRRERDMRFKAPQKPDLQKQDQSVSVDQGTSRALSSFIDPSVSWTDLPWLASLTKLPIALKGVQTGEDAVLAVQRGCKAIVVSNHGGRQVDTARSGCEVLPEVVLALKKAGLRNKCQVFVDGGVRRGTDIFKLLCLGADGVGVGRPVLHALASYGEDGVARMLDMLQSELEFCFASCGCTSIKDIRGDHIVAKL